MFYRRLLILIFLFGLPMLGQAQESGELLPPVELKPDTLRALQKADSAILKAHKLIDQTNAIDTVIYNTVSKMDSFFEASDVALNNYSKAYRKSGYAIEGDAIA